MSASVDCFTRFCREQQHVGSVVGTRRRAVVEIFMVVSSLFVSEHVFYAPGPWRVCRGSDQGELVVYVIVLKLTW